MNKCETCLWGCFELSDNNEDVEICPHYYDATESEFLDEAYIENRKTQYQEEWNVYVEGWN